MSRVGLTFVVLASVALAGCGGSSKSSNPIAKGIDGFWSADLQTSDGSHVLVFNTVLAQASGAALSITSLSIFDPSPCFSSATNSSGTFTVTGNADGYQTGPFTMTVSTVSNTNDQSVVSLTGTRSGNGRISGNWTVTGFPGCNGNGTFLMSPPE